MRSDTLRYRVAERQDVREAVEIVERVEAAVPDVHEQRRRLERHAKLLEVLDPEVAATLRSYIEREDTAA